jgi:hypothetical protein
LGIAVEKGNDVAALRASGSQCAAVERNLDSFFVKSREEGMCGRLICLHIPCTLQAMLILQKIMAGS